MKKNKITQINCHAEFSSASHEILKQVQDDRNNESGRSMVEMLGVLAIIGVLSVGGIAGYTTAMRSHRTNEIVNACSLLYVVGNTKNESDAIEYQTVLGSLPTGVSELKYNNGTITAKITDAAVCTEVKNKLGNKVSGDCSETASSLTVKLGEATTPLIENTRDNIEDKECSFTGYCYVKGENEHEWFFMSCSAGKISPTDMCEGTEEECSWVLENPPCNTLL